MDEQATHRWTRRGLISAVAVAGAGAAAPASSAATPPPLASSAPDVTRVPADQVTPPWREEGFVATSAGRIHWVAMGEGEPVLLLPKLGGWVADWRRVAPMLADRHRLIAMDPPGHGGSSMSVQPPYILTQEESASMIVKALDALGVERCAVVGNSMGGSIGLVMSVLWPHRVSRLALISTALPPASSLQDIIASKVNHVFDGEFTFAKSREIFGSSRETYEEHAKSIEQDRPWLSPSERGVRRAGLSDYFSRTPTPPLMIYGDRSGGGYRLFLPDLQKRRPDIRIAEIPNSGTFTHQDNPEATAKVLQDFLG